MSLDRDLEVPRGVPTVSHRVVKVRPPDASECQDHLAVEEPLEIRLGGISLTVTMRTPGEDEELVAGFLFSESVITSADDLDVIARYRGPDGDPDDGNAMNVLLKGDVRVAKDRLRRNFVASSSCGLCGKATIDAIRAALPPVQSDLVISVERLNRLAAAMLDAQSTFEKTGGLHAAGLFDADGRLIVLREDIGRHNAVDKVIGHMVLARSDAARPPRADGQRARELRDHAESPDRADPGDRRGLGTLEHGGPDGARRRHDPDRVHAERRIQSLRRCASCDAARRGTRVRLRVFLIGDTNAALAS